MLRIKGMKWTAEKVELWNQKEEEKNEKTDDGFTGNKMKNECVRLCSDCGKKI
jgi:hypothetical protein